MTASCAGSICWTRDGPQDRTRASLKSVACLDVRETGALVPIDADGGGPQRATQASSMRIGREGAICEVIEIMQISLVRAMRPRL
jgi:hypothetical protein